MYLSWHITVYGKRVATKLARMFNAESLITHIDRISEHVGNEAPRPTQWYMVRVHNPGVESANFAARCDAIYDKFNQNN